MELSLDRKYNFNVIKEIAVTDSFLSLADDIKGCHEQILSECITRKYNNALLEKCQCLPFQMNLTEEVGRIISLIQGLCNGCW